MSDAHSLGLAVFCFYEMNPTYPAYFTFAQGAEDARQAEARLTELGAPDGTVVYYAIDVNIDPNLTTEYFNGIESATTPKSTPGCYGFQRMCEFAYSQFPNIGKHLWQTYGQKTVPLDGWQHLQENRAGVAVDVNECSANVNGWKGAPVDDAEFMEKYQRLLAGPLEAEIQQRAKDAVDAAVKTVIAKLSA